MRCLSWRMITEHTLFRPLLSVWLVGVHLLGVWTKRWSSSDHHSVGSVRRLDVYPSYRGSLTDGRFSTNSTVIVATRHWCASSLCLKSRQISMVMKTIAFVFILVHPVPCIASLPFKPFLVLCFPCIHNYICLTLTNIQKGTLAVGMSSKPEREKGQIMFESEHAIPSENVT